MLSVLMIWAVALVIFAILGRTCLILMYGKENIFEKEYDINIIAGMCICNLYAQFLSIYMPIGLWAFVGITIISLFTGIWLYRKKVFFPNFKIWFRPFLKREYVFLSLIVLIGVVLWTTITPQHYDTYLYHAQAIRWIEEYGIVPGLGNLHYRFAYNSSYMTLQALFSFKWFTGQSFHAMNGFITVFMLLYVMNTLLHKDDRNFRCSDLLKVACLVYILYDCRNISSPNTDTVALLLAYYVLIKWAEYSEKDNADKLQYSLLCILVVYVTTIKLSVGIFVLLVMYPAIILVKEKRIVDIVKHLALGIVILIPYIARNIIISGYALYPYEATAIKSLDWIMPADLLQVDRNEIIAWGRGHADTSCIDEHIWQWFGGWFSSINILWKILMVFSLIALIYILVVAFKRRKEFTFSPMVCMNITCIIGLFFWLFTAPLPRYGVIYMTSIPCLAMSLFLRKHAIERDLTRFMRILKYAFGIFYIIVFIGYSYVCNLGIPSIVRQSDYDNKPTYTVTSSSIDYAIPSEWDLAGYDPFPETPHATTAESIRLRGEGLKDGFRN